MPHIDIKHFPVDISKEKKEKFISEITSLILDTFQCNEEAISIIIEPIDPDNWNDCVFDKDIIPRKKWLEKLPGYRSIDNF